MGFRGIERSTGVCHNTVINWVKKAAFQIPEENYEIPETAQLDELQTFVGSKKAARPRVAERRKGTLAKTTKFGSGQQ